MNTYHIHRDSCESGQDLSAGEYDGEFRKFLPCLWDRGTCRWKTTREWRAARDTRAARSEGRIAGARRKARLAFTAARWRLNARAFVASQMLITVSTRKFERSVRLPEGDVPMSNDSGLSKSAASWSFVALWARDLSGRGLLVIQIEGMHMDEDRPVSGSSILVPRRAARISPRMRWRT